MGIKIVCEWAICNADKSENSKDETDYEGAVVDIFLDKYVYLLYFCMG